MDFPAKPMGENDPNSTISATSMLELCPSRARARASVELLMILWQNVEPSSSFFKKLDKSSTLAIWHHFPRFGTIKQGFFEPFTSLFPLQVKLCSRAELFCPKSLTSFLLKNSARLELDTLGSKHSSTIDLSFVTLGFGGKGREVPNK